MMCDSWWDSSSGQIHFDREFLQRRFWDKFYDRYSDWYDCVDWFTKDAAHKLRLYALDNYMPNTTSSTQFSILEVGVGTGKLHVELAQRYPNAQLAGLDLAPGMIQLTQKRLQRRQINQNATARSDLHVGDISHGSDIELAMALDPGDDFLVHGSVAAIGDDAFAVLQFVVLVPHFTGIANNDRHGSIDDD